MSVIIDTSKFSKEKRLEILKDLTIQPPETEYGQEATWYLFTSINDQQVAVPFYYYNSKIRSDNEPFGNTEKKFSKTDLTFSGELREIQLEIKNEVFKYLNKYHSLLLSLFTGGGKTAFSIWLATQLKYKTLICAPRVPILEQWMDSIIKFVPEANVQLLDASNKLDESADFYVINIDTVAKRNDLTDIGLLVIDEAHCAYTELRSLGILTVSPRYVLALTATADNSKGMDKIADLIYGPRIIRKMFRPFNVYIVDTNYKPAKCTNKIGKMDWTGTIKDMCLNDDRNDLIVRIAEYFITRNFIILCKRKDQVEELYQKLNKDENSLIEKYTGTQKKFNRDCRILCSTYSKSGIGFDFPKLDALIIASDVDEGIEQYLGRVFRREDSVPIIFDLRESVWKNHPFAKHLSNRCALYEKSGGMIKNFEDYFILPEN
jgi:superfamily II DNA or RNA helicase